MKNIQFFKPVVGHKYYMLFIPQRGVIAKVYDHEMLRLALSSAMMGEELIIVYAGDDVEYMRKIDKDFQALSTVEERNTLIETLQKQYMYENSIDMKTTEEYPVLQMNPDND